MAQLLQLRKANPVSYVYRNIQISESSHSLLCECCSEWEHHSCSGISSELYDVLNNDPCPNIMFFCSICHPKVILAFKFFNEIQDNHAWLEERLEIKLAQSTSVKSGKRANIVSGSSHHDSSNQLSAQSQGTASLPKPPQMVKFMVVIYRIKESPPSTPKATRINCDLENLQHTLSNIDSSLNTSCILDFYRLGKFNTANLKPRPLLVKFLRVFDATLVLSKRGSLPSSIYVKPNLTLEESSAFLRARWNLIQNNTDKKSIKLRGNNIYMYQ